MKRVVVWLEKELSSSRYLCIQGIVCTMFSIIQINDLYTVLYVQNQLLGTVKFKTFIFCLTVINAYFLYFKINLQSLQSELSMKKILLTLLCLYGVIAAHTFNKILVEDRDAFCLDGTKPAYYVHQGDKNKFILSFEGGGWCGSHVGLEQTLEDCFQRSKTALGSSASYPATMAQYEGILSDNQQNPFRDWTIIHMKYCDGTGHQGFKKDPIQYKGVKLYFRGHNATIGQLNSIDQRFSIFSVATDIIITGQSAGGLATFLWSNYIAERAPKSSKVWSVPDSGIFLDEVNFNTKTRTYKQIFQNFMSISNEQVDPPTSECVAANKQQKWKCMFAEYNHAFIKIPLFAIESLYDSWSIHYILGIGCGSAGSLAGCSVAQMAYIDQYRRNTSAVLVMITNNQNNGCWAPACSNHVYSTGSSFYSANFRIPASSQFSAEYSLAQWISGTSSNLVGNYEHIDSQPWPNNKPCSGLASAIQE